MRTLVTLALTAMLLVPACDPERAARSSTVGWTVRLDEPEATGDSARVSGDGVTLEVRPGPNATLWHADRRATGTYRLAADVTHLDSGLHPHGAGLAFGGTAVDGDQQAYAYFLVRGDGHFLIKIRNGEDLKEIVLWTEHAAVSKEDTKGVTANHLAVEVGAEQTRFFVNDTEVHTTPTADLPTDGQFGFRLVHDLHVRFGEPTLSTL
ncbi:MAG: hypothetical protein AAF628_07815 [Planctomycetota bacterium]